MLYKQFYSELGKLLYAVADIDGVISQKEKKTLLQIIQKELAPAEKHTDEHGTNAAYYTGIEFDFLDEQIADTESAFESFIDFVVDHHTAFDSKLKKVSMHVARELAAAYHGTSRKEKKLVDKLKKVIGKIEVKQEKEKRLHEEDILLTKYNNER